MIKMDNTYCQSCAMPMEKNREIYGTEVDGSKNMDYCKYCYQKGQFTSNVNMEEMINICIPHMKDSGMTEEQAKKMLNEVLPLLKRWKSN